LEAILLYMLCNTCALALEVKKRDLCHSFSLQPRNRERNMMEGSSYYEWWIEWVIIYIVESLIELAKIVTNDIFKNELGF
jgi:hypothetical protein